MTTRNIIEGLAILEKYHNDPAGYNCGAEHDVIHAYPTDERLCDDDLNRMIALGWLQEGTERDEHGGFKAEFYDAEEGWFCFT